MSDPTPQPGVSTSSAGRAPGDLPTWLVVIVVLLSVGGGGALVWWYFTAPAKVVTVALNEPAPRRRVVGDQQQPPQRQEWNSDVRQTNNGFQARTGNVQLVARRRDDRPYNLAVFYRTPLVPQDQLSVLRATAAAGREEQAQRLKLTPEQIEALRNLRVQRGMVIAAEDEATLRAAFDAFEKAAPDQRQEPKAKLLEVLASLEQKNLEPTKAALLASVESVRKILTPEQVQLLQQGN